MLQDTKPNDKIVIAITINSTTSRATPDLALLLLFDFSLIVITYYVASSVKQVARPAEQCGTYLTLVRSTVLINIV